MYAQFFGNYLLSKQAVTKEQLLRAIEEQHVRHIRLGTLAVHAGFMTTEQVSAVLDRQKQEDKRFGELAVDEGFLTREQLEDLLRQQTPDYLLIGESLVESGVLSGIQLEGLIKSYQSENELSQLDDTATQKENLHMLISNFFMITLSDAPDYLTKYLALLFNNLIRFIGKDFTPLNPTLCTEYVTTHCAGQIINGEFSMISYLDMDEETSISFASRYSGSKYTAYDAYVQASLDDFLNIHNGLFSVNISNEKSVELTLNPAIHMENTMITSATKIFFLPILYPFGTLNFLFKL